MALGVAHRADLGRDEEARDRRPRPTTNSVLPPPMSSTSSGSPACAPAGRAQVGEPRLALARDRLRLEPEALAQLALELGAVVGVAHRAREHGDHPLDAVLVDRLAGSRAQVASTRSIASSLQPAGAVHALAQPRDARAPLELPHQPAVARPRRPAAAWSWCRCRRPRRARRGTLSQACNPERSMRDTSGRWRRSADADPASRACAASPTSGRSSSSLVAGAVLVMAAPSGPRDARRGDLRDERRGAVRRQRALPPHHWESAARAAGCGASTTR